MANQKIFCAVPWHNTHLYWDGTYGACCFEAQQPIGSTYNLKTTNLVRWFNSDTMQNFRQRILSNEPLPECQNCYYEENSGHESKRIKENYKVAIFTEHAFEKSFKESPWNTKFVPTAKKLPIDWHIDFGNECNLACKMCHPGASSKIASYYDKWKINYEKKSNWVNDENSWNQFLANVICVPNIHRIHVMGGEPFLNKKFLEFVQWLVDNDKTNISLSFVTNGTQINQRLLDNLLKFSRVDIEVSVEATSINNQYIRQGSNTDQVWENIKFLHSLQNDSFQIVLRSVPQLLSVNNYHEYIWRAFELGLSVQSIFLRTPQYLAIDVLPYEIRQDLKANYYKVKDKITQQSKLTFKTMAVGRDPSRLSLQLERECDTVINFLDKPEPLDKDKLRYELIAWLKKWDVIYNHNALQIYPEYGNFLTSYGYL